MSPFTESLANLKVKFLDCLSLFVGRKKASLEMTGLFGFDDLAESQLLHYAKLIGVPPNAVGIKSFKSRWGSCHVNGNIMYNWKIIMAPNRIVDYVVVHELCHLKHHDHSPKFWKAVEKVILDYRDCKEWLKENGRSLEV